MIVKQDLSWIRLLFSVHGSSITRTFPRILLITAFSVLVTGIELRYRIDDRYSLTSTPFTLIGVALSIFLGFRNNAAYDRYWEARKLWGQLVNTSRSFARQTLTLVNPPSDNEGEEAAVRQFQEDLVERSIAFVHALRHHLRNSDPFDDLRRFLSEPELEFLRTQKNVPTAMLQDMGLRLRTAWKDGWISDFHLPVLETSLVSLTDILGACERIKNTPIPFAYTVLTHRIVAFYCFALPFGLVRTVGELTPVVVLLISHAFFGLDEIGDEVEDPFGTEPQHLPLTTLCRAIEVNLLQSIGRHDVPELLQPVKGILE